MPLSIQSPAPPHGGGERRWTPPTRSRCRPTPTSRSLRARRTVPIVPAAATLPEATPRSVSWGVFLCVVFTVASAYSGLKVGQVMEAAIPISILAIGLARVYRAALEPARERHHHGHRRRLGSDRRRGDLHAAGALHPEARPAPGADDLHLPGRRLPGRALPDPAAPLLRARDARPASRFPRRPRSPRCWSPARRAARRRAAAAGDRRSRASTTSSSRRSTSGSEFVDFQFVPAVQDARRPGADRRSRSTRSPSSSGSAT